MIPEINPIVEFSIANADVKPYYPLVKQHYKSKRVYRCKTSSCYSCACKYIHARPIIFDKINAFRTRSAMITTSRPIDPKKEEKESNTN